MKATLARADLARALDGIRPALPPRPTHPILAAAVLVVADGTLTATATNYELTITRTLPADDAADGTALVSGQKLRDLVSKFTASQVALQVDGPVLVVTAGRSSYRLALMRAEEHPARPPLPPQVGALPAGALAEATKSLQHAVSNDPSVPNVLGALLDVEDGILWAVATDRYRFAVHPLDYTGTEFRARIEMSALHAAKSLDGPVDVHANDRLIAFVADNASITVTQIEGEGVRWQTVRDIVPEMPFTADTAEVIAALDRTLLVTERQAFIDIDVKDGVMRIAADTQEAATGAEEVDVDGDLTASFLIRPSYLREAIACIDAPRLLIGARTNPLHPVVVRGCADNSQEPTAPMHVVQPARKK